MVTLSERIENLEYNIEKAREAAHYAEGQAYRNEMLVISKMEQRLHDLKKELANASANESC